VQLSGGAGPADFMKILKYAYRAGASGYLAGRAIWAQAFKKFPDLEAMEKDLATQAVAVVDEANELTDKMATPWSGHGSWSDGVEMTPTGPDFAPEYAKLLSHLRSKS
jgi:tagatose 1,6-diphosphate aldolase